MSWDPKALFAYLAGRFDTSGHVSVGLRKSPFFLGVRVDLLFDRMEIASTVKAELTKGKIIFLKKRGRWALRFKGNAALWFLNNIQSYTYEHFPVIQLVRELVDTGKQLAKQKGKDLRLWKKAVDAKARLAALQKKKAVIPPPSSYEDIPLSSSDEEFIKMLEEILDSQVIKGESEGFEEEESVESLKGE